MYRCESGYQLQSNSSTRSCIDGQWDGDQPVCIFNLQSNYSTNVLYELTAEEISQASTVQYNELTGSEFQPILWIGVAFSVFALLIGIVFASFNWIRRLVCFKYLKYLEND